MKKNYYDLDPNKLRKRGRIKYISNVGQLCFSCKTIIKKVACRCTYYWHINPYQVVKKKPFCSIECLDSFRSL